LQARIERVEKLEIKSKLSTFSPPFRILFKLFFYLIKLKQLLNLSTVDGSKAILTNNTQLRTYLLLHEYVSMGLLQEFGVKVPKYKTATSAAQVKEITASGGLTA
jgi:hypothetical protein